MNLASMLNESAEKDNPSFAWDLVRNAFGAVHVKAASLSTHADRGEACAAAARLLNTIEEADELRGLTTVDGWFGAGFDADADAWRGQIDMAFNAPEVLH